jgi:hypothetical protein
MVWLLQESCPNADSSIAHAVRTSAARGQWRTYRIRSRLVAGRLTSTVAVVRAAVLRAGTRRVAWY